MKEINLPLVSMEIGLGSAMSVLRKSKRAALLSEDEGRYHLFTAGSIAAARAQGVETLVALKLHPTLKPKVVGGGVALPSQRRRPMSGRPAGATAAPARARGQTKFLTLPSRNYVVTKVSTRSALLGVRSENIASIFISRPAAYYCTRPVRPHSFSAGVQVGDPCPRLDGYYIVAT